MHLSVFVRLIGRPSYFGRSLQEDWGEYEETVGCVLPSDYKQFMSAYGPGCIGDTLLLFHPKVNRGDSDINLFDELEGVVDTYADLRRQANFVQPFPVYPEEGGCLPVGRTSGGNQLFLRPPISENNDWSVVLDLGEWVHYPWSFTYFIHQALSGNLDVPFMDEQELSFESVGVLLS
ncbi:SMI1/KNR4 family protein [Streptomyces mayteni]